MNEQAKQEAQKIRQQVDKIPFDKWRDSKMNDTAKIRRLKQRALLSANQLSSGNGFNKSEFLTACGF